MKTLGTVQEITLEGRLLLRGEFAPPKGSSVLDNRRRKLGRVQRVFGPVDSPYISVQPTDDLNLLGMMGKQVYTKEGEIHGKS